MPSQRMRDYWESAATYDAAEDGLPGRPKPAPGDRRTPSDCGLRAWPVIWVKDRQTSGFNPKRGTK